MRYKRRRWEAMVRAEGSLAYGNDFGSTYALGAKLQDAPSCHGWTFWHLEDGGEARVLDAARER